MIINDTVRAIVTVHISGNRTHISVLPIGADYNAWTNTYTGTLRDDDVCDLACEYLTLEETARAVVTRTDIPGGYVLAVSV